MSTGNILISHMPTTEQYFEAAQKFKGYLSNIDYTDEMETVVLKLELILDHLFLNENFLRLVYETVRAEESATSTLFNSDIGEAVISRLESILNGASSELQSSISLLVSFLDDLASSPSLQQLVDISRMIINTHMEAVDRNILLGYWFIFGSAPNHGKLGSAICAMKSTFRKIAQRGLPESRYTLDVERARNLWGNSTFSTVSDLFSTTTEIGGRSFRAPTNMVGQTEDTIRLIAYNASDWSNQQDIIRFCRPGELLVSVCHHSPHPSSDLKEKIKLQCTHSQLVVGFKNEQGQDQVCTLNSPIGYCGGGFTGATYPMIFVKPMIPRVVPDAVVKYYVDNIRTWAVIADSFCGFPGDYNGGDPLRTRNLSHLLQYGSKCLEALSGDSDAIEWLQRDENLLYCAEMVYVVLNLGIHYPLNRSCIEQYNGSLYPQVKEQVESKGFVARVSGMNDFMSSIDMCMAPEDLRPISEVLKLNTSAIDTDVFCRHMAIQPATFADVILDYVSQVLPREVYGEEVAPFQKALFAGMSDSIREKFGYDDMSPAMQQGMDRKLREIGEALGRGYADGYSFRVAMEGLVEEARRFTTGEFGQGFFAPPSLFMTRTTQYIGQMNDSGLLNWQYVGHGLHHGILREN